MKKTTAEILRTATEAVARNHRAREEWIERRSKLARSSIVQRSLTEVKEAIACASSRHSEMMAALDGLQEMLKQKARRHTYDARPAGHGAGRIDLVLAEGGKRADAAFESLLDTARIRVALESAYLARLLAPNDDPKVTSLLRSLAQNGAEVAVNFTPIGNAVAVAKAVKKASDDINKHGAKPWPVDIVLADSWFILSDLLKAHLDECERRMEVAAAELRYWNAFMQNDHFVGRANR